MSSNFTSSPNAGFTLTEVVMSIGILGLVCGGVIQGSVFASKRAEWGGLSMAASALGNQQLEQARSAVWDNSIGKNEITNLNLVAWNYNTNSRSGSGYSWATLDLPVAGTNIVIATNYVSVKTIYFNNTAVPPVEMQMLTVDTVWPFSGFSKTRYYTNRTATYFGPDNRDASSL